MTTTTRTLTVKETAAALRKALKAAFPGVKFSVVMSRGTAYGWMSCSWTDGPRTEDVNAICAMHTDRSWNGMTDSYDSTNGAAVTENGQVITFSCCGINTHRHISDAAIAWASEATGHTGDLPAGETISAPGEDQLHHSPYNLSEYEALRMWCHAREIPPL